MKAAVEATAGALICFLVRHGLRELFGQEDQLSVQIRNALYINLKRVSFSSFYVPRIETSVAKQDGTWLIEGRYGWRVRPFKL